MAPDWPKPPLRGATEPEAATEARDRDEQLRLLGREPLRELQQVARRGLVVAGSRELAEVNDAAELSSGVQVADRHRDVVLTKLLRQRFGQTLAVTRDEHRLVRSESPTP